MNFKNKWKIGKLTNYFGFDNCNVDQWFIVGVSRHFRDSIDNIHSLNDVTEYWMFIVKVIVVNYVYEELTTS